MGVTENMVHSRIYTPIQLEFYVDNEYKALKFLEHWMEFIPTVQHHEKIISQEELSCENAIPMTTSVMRLVSLI